MPQYLVLIVISMLYMGRGTVSAEPAVSAPPAQEQRASAAADLVAKMPANSIEEGQELAAALMKLGGPGLHEVIGMVLPPGEGDDAHARFALNGAAWYVTRPGAEKERQLFARTLIDGLRSDLKPDVKVFLISLLQKSGRDEAVAPLGRLLADPVYGDPAIRALMTIANEGSRQVSPVLVRALPAASGANQIGLIQALGLMRDPSAVRELLKLAGGSAAVQEAALDALANTGDPAATQVLMSAARAGGPWPRSHAMANALRFTRRLAERGNRREAVAICRDILRMSTAPRETGFVSDALSTLVDVTGKDALPDLLKAAGSDNKQLRAAALALTRRFPDPGVTDALLAQLKDAAPDAKVDLLYALRVRNDAAALPAVLGELQSPDPQVRGAALDAASHYPTSESVTALLAMNPSDPGEASALQDALLRVPDETLRAALLPALALPTAPAHRVMLLKVLAARRWPEGSAAAFTAASDPDETVRTAAFKALGALADPKAAGQLIETMLKTPEGPSRDEAQNAVVAVSSRTASPQDRATPLLAALPGTTGNGRSLLLDTLARVGGKEAMEALVKEARSTDAAARGAAIRELSEQGDASALPGLLDLARSAATPGEKALALRGYLRLVGESGAGSDVVSMYRQALAVSQRPEEKRLVLAGLSNRHDVEALKLVGTLLGDRVVGGEAAVAALRIANAPKDGDQPLKDEESAAVIRQVATTAADGDIRNAAYTYIKNYLEPGSPVDLADLAKGKPVTASVNSEGSHKPELAVDGDAASLESAWFGERSPASLTVDLGTVQQVSTAQVFFYWDGARYYQYTLEVSPDGKTWKGVADRSQNTDLSTPAGVRLEWPPINARYVRLNVLKNSANQAVHVVELKVYGPGAAPPPQNTPALASTPDPEGFTSLFNGKDLTGWMGALNGYAAADGIIACIKERGGDLYTQQEFSDFTLRFQFRLTPGANNGIGIRSPGVGDSAYSAMEIQVLDDSAEMYKDLHPYQFHGSIYGVVPAERGHQKPVGEWNDEEITARGRQVTIRLNGVTIVDADLDKASAGGTADHRDHPGLKNLKGHIGFLGHGALVEFRNIRIKELGK